MGHFQERYTEPQRQAIREAIVIKGMSGAAACRAAAAGKLKIPAFTMATSTAYQLAHAYRTKLETQRAELMKDNPLEDIGADSLRELMGGLAAEARAILRPQTQGKGIDLDRATACARAIGEVQKAASTGRPKGQGIQGPPSTSKTTPATPGLIEQLARAQDAPKTKAENTGGDNTDDRGPELSSDGSAATSGSSPIARP